MHNARLHMAEGSMFRKKKMSNAIWNETKVTVKTELNMSELLGLILQLEKQAQYEIVMETICYWNEERQNLLKVWLNN